MRATKETTIRNYLDLLEELYILTSGTEWKHVIISVIVRKHHVSTVAFTVCVTDFLEVHPKEPRCYRWKGTKAPTRHDAIYAHAKASRLTTEMKTHSVETLIKPRITAVHSHWSPIIHSNPKPGIFVQLRNFLFYDPSKNRS